MRVDLAMGYVVPANRTGFLEVDEVVVGSYDCGYRLIPTGYPSAQIRSKPRNHPCRYTT
jgi:hypothetical protein